MIRVFAADLQERDLAPTSLPRHSSGSRIARPIHRTARKVDDIPDLDRLGGSRRGNRTDI